MAILNIANQYDQKYLNWSDQLALIFTKDKHIITHGVDYLSDYANSVRGLVPNYNLGDSFGVLGKNGWLSLSTDLSAADNNTLPSTKAVTDYVSTYVGNQIVANSLMTFKGVIKISNNKFWYQKVGDSSFTEGLPLSGKIGDYYRIWVEDVAINIIGRIPQSGDSILCIQDYTVTNSADANKTDYWLFLDTNVKGTTTLNVGGTEVKVLSDSSKTVNIYTPNSKGGDGQILVSAGTDLPVWKTVSVSANNGRFILQIGDKKYEADITADSLKNTLTFGTGLSTGSFNGSSNVTLNLLQATTSSLGGIKVAQVLDKELSSVNVSSTTIDENRCYGLELDKNGNAFVYVPYQNYNEVSRQSSGLAPIIPAANTITPTIQSLSTEWVLSVNSDGTTSWKQLPPQIETTDTWRNIYVNGTSLDSNALNITTVEKGSIGIVKTNVNGVTNVGFELLWWDLDADGGKGAYEINN